MKMKLELDGRKVVNQDSEHLSTGIVRHIELDDGTTLKITQTAKKFDVESNKEFEFSSDGESVRIID